MEAALLQSYFNVSNTTDKLTKRNDEKDNRTYIVLHVRIEREPDEINKIDENHAVLLRNCVKVDRLRRWPQAPVSLKIKKYVLQ